LADVEEVDLTLVS
jgi:hypothetical protein